MTEQEIIMLGVAIDSHVKMLLNEEEAYKRNGNTEAIKECLAEVKRFKELKEKLENYGKDNQDLEHPKELHGVSAQAASDAV